MVKMFDVSNADPMLIKLGKQLINGLLEELPAEAIMMAVLYWLTGKRKEKLLVGKDQQPLVDVRGELMADITQTLGETKDSPFWQYLMKKAAAQEDNAVVDELIKVPVAARQMFFQFLNKLEEEEIDYVVDLLRHDKIHQLLLQAHRWLSPKLQTFVQKFDSENGTKVFDWVARQAKDFRSVLSRALLEIEKKQEETYQKKKRKWLPKISFGKWWWPHLTWL